jgi:hypothetical protein
MFYLKSLRLFSVKCCLVSAGGLILLLLLLLLLLLSARGNLEETGACDAIRSVFV